MSRTTQLTFKENLEAAIIDNRRIACPNPECNDMIVSKETITSKTRSKLNYWCRNNNCTYHEVQTKIVQYPRAVTDNLNAPSTSKLEEVEENDQIFTTSALIIGLSAALGFIMNLVW